MCELNSNKHNISHRDHDSEFTDSFKEYYHKEEYFDLILICKEQVCVKTQKMLFISVSDFIKKILLSRKEEERVFISLPDIDSNTVTLLIYLLLEGLTKVNLIQLNSLKELLTFLRINLENTVISVAKSLTEDMGIKEPTKQIIYNETIDAKFRLKKSITAKGPDLPSAGLNCPLFPFTVKQEIETPADNYDPAGTSELLSCVKVETEDNFIPAEVDTVYDQPTDDIMLHSQVGISAEPTVMMLGSFTNPEEEQKFFRKNMLSDAINVSEEEEDVDKSYFLSILHAEASPKEKESDPEYFPSSCSDTESSSSDESVDMSSSESGSSSDGKNSNSNIAPFEGLRMLLQERIKEFEKQDKVHKKRGRKRKKRSSPDDTSDDEATVSCDDSNESREPDSSRENNGIPETDDRKRKKCSSPDEKCCDDRNESRKLDSSNENNGIPQTDGFPSQYPSNTTENFIPGGHFLEGTHQFCTSLQPVEIKVKIDDENTETVNADCCVLAQEEAHLKQTSNEVIHDPSLLEEYMEINITECDNSIYSENVKTNTDDIKERKNNEI